MEKELAFEICRDELIANAIRGYYTDKAHAMKVMKAIAITYSMADSLRLVTEISEDYFGTSETTYKISLR